MIVKGPQTTGGFQISTFVDSESLLNANAKRIQPVLARIAE